MMNMEKAAGAALILLVEGRCHSMSFTEKSEYLQDSLYRSVRDAVVGNDLNSFTWKRRFYSPRYTCNVIFNKGDDIRLVYEVEYKDLVVFLRGFL